MISACPERFTPRPSLGASCADSSIATAAPTRWWSAKHRQGGGGFSASLPSKPRRASFVIAPVGEALRHKRRPSHVDVGPCQLFRSLEIPTVTLPGDARTTPDLLPGHRRIFAKAPSARAGGSPGKGNTDRSGGVGRWQLPAATQAGSADDATGNVTRGANHVWTS